jgi:CheY-like chemotaxis protein
MIIDVVTEALQDGGFTVRPEHDAEGALRALEECSDSLAALITDVNLASKVTGWELARRARALRPDLPVVYTSGYASAHRPREGVPHSILVPKPYAPAQIVSAIAALIDQAGSEPAPMPGPAIRE